MAILHGLHDIVHTQKKKPMQCPDIGVVPTKKKEAKQRDKNDWRWAGE